MAYVLSQSQKQKKSAPQVESTAIPTGGAPSSAGTPSNNTTPQDFTKSNYSNTNAIIQRNQNAGNAISNRVLQPAQQQAQSMKQGLENKATNYLDTQKQQAQKQYSTPDAGDIRRGIAADNSAGYDAYGYLSNYLNGTANQVNQFDPGAYNPLAASQAVKGNDVSGIVAKGAKNNYTSGMGALDNLIFRRSSGYGDVAKGVNQLNNNLIQQRNELVDPEKGLTSQAQKSAEDIYSQGKEALKTNITGQAGTIKSAAEAAAKKAAADYDAAYPLGKQSDQMILGNRLAAIPVRSQMEKLAQNMTGDAAHDAPYKAALERIADTFSLNDMIGDSGKVYNSATGNVLDALKSKNLMISDPRNYYSTFTAPDANTFIADKYIDQGQADNYNRIMSLLGSNERMNKQAQDQLGMHSNDAAIKAKIKDILTKSGLNA